MSSKVSVQAAISQDAGPMAITASSVEATAITINVLGTLKKPEMDALLATSDMTIAQGRRDHALLLFLYNAGARADEIAQVRISDLTLPQVPDRDLASVSIRGKGNKTRRCPLWAQTVRELTALVQGRDPDEHVFLNRCGRPITRFGIHTLVERCVSRAVKSIPSLAAKRVSPHTVRHTTATHLLRSGVDINTIRAWLGHVSLATTNIYAEVGPGDESQGAGQLRSRWRERWCPMEGRQRTDGVSANVVAYFPPISPAISRNFRIRLTDHNAQGKSICQTGTSRRGDGEEQSRMLAGIR
jgi:hypothetical protein